MSNLEQTKELIKVVFRGNKKKAEKKCGFFLEAHFGKPKWTAKDLSEEELVTFNAILQRKIAKEPCCISHNDKIKAWTPNDSGWEIEKKQALNQYRKLIGRQAKAREY